MGVRSGGVIEIGALIDKRPIGALQWRVLLLCSLVAFLDGFDTQVMALTVPAIAKAWGVERAAFGFALSASLVGLGVGAAALAPLGDRIGRRPMLIWSMVVLGLSTAAIAMAGSVQELIALRFLTGVGLGVSIANSTALVSDYLPVTRRTAFVTLVFCTSAIGSILAGVLAPWLIAGGGWQNVFLAGGLPAVAAAAILAMALPESLRILLARRPDDPRIASLLTALAPGEIRSRVVADRAIIASGTSLARLLAPDFRARTLMAWGIFALNLFTVYLIVSWVPTLLVSVGWPQAQALHGAAAIQFGGLIGGLMIAALAAQGRLREGLAGAFLTGGLCLGLFLLTTPTVPAWTALLILTGAGTAGTQFALNGLAAALYPAEIRATGHGWALVVGRISAIVAPIVGGWLIHFAVPVDRLLGLLAIPLVIAALLTLRVRRDWICT